MRAFFPRIVAYALLMLSGTFSSSVFGQGWLVEPVDPAVSPHDVLVRDVVIRGGDIYVEVDRQEVNGNMVGAFLSPEAAQDLAQDGRYIVEPDRQIAPRSGGGPVPWSPDRIDQRAGTDMAYLPPVLEMCGENRPFIYVCDTGVLGKHDEFALAGDRLRLAGSYIPASLPRTVFSAWEDPDDHGTGVASCAIGETLGAGRCPVNLVSAVCYPDPGALPTSSFASYAIDVIYWSIAEHNLRTTGDDDPFNDASVLVFASSTTTGPSMILDLAVQRAFLAGMSVVVSAGNQNQDASMTSPAGAFSNPSDTTLTVAASTDLDARWGGSNFGPRVELFAPGEDVLVASSTGTNVCVVASGTSYSAGYAAGAAVRILAPEPVGIAGCGGGGFDRSGGSRLRPERPV